MIAYVWHYAWEYPLLYKLFYSTPTSVGGKIYITNTFYTYYKVTKYPQG